MNWKTNLVIMTILMGLTGCSIFGSDSPKVDSFKQQWETQGFTDYSFDLMISCFCGITPFTPARVTVLADTIAAAVRISDDIDLENSVLQQLKTIDDLFDIIDDATNGGADQIETEYDQSLGYPTSIAIDYIENAVDDEVSYSASNVVEIKTKSQN